MESKLLLLLLLSAGGGALSFGGGGGGVFPRAGRAAAGRVMTMSASSGQGQAAPSLAPGELASKARAIVDANMGLRNPGALAPEFKLVQSYRPSLDKAQYIAEYGNAKLEVAFPDLFWNAYDFREDAFDKNRVWATIRPTGTHRGVFKADGKEIEPTFRRLDAAPECVLFDFDDSGKCTAMSSGFCMDRSVGNSGPVGGLWGVLEAVGQPVPNWKHRPPANLVSDAISRSFRQQRPLTQSPIPEKLMLGVAKALSLVMAESPANAADLLSEDFEYSTPFSGPLKKNALLSQGTLKSICPSYKQEAYDFRVDALEPARVWWTYRGSGTAEGGKSFKVGPQAASATFDTYGFVCKLTMDYVMDPAAGDSSGLGGRYGLLEAMGTPAPETQTRPVPESIRRAKSALLPPTKKVPTKAAPSPAPVSTVVPTVPAATAPKSKAVAAKPPAAASTPKVTSAPKPASKPTPRPVSKPAPKPAPKPTPAAKPVTTASTSTKVKSKEAPVVTQQKSKPTSMGGGMFGAFAPKPKPAASVPASAAASADAETKKPVGKASTSESSFGGLFGGIAGSKSKAPPAPEAATVPSKAEPAAKAPLKAAPAAPVTVEFDGKLKDAIEGKIGAQKLSIFEKRTNSFLRGAINASNYYGSLRDFGLLPLAKDIVAFLPQGNQRKALEAFMTSSTASAK